MRAVVTGVAGFIGSHLAERLLEQGYEVTGIDCFVPYYPREVKERNLATLRDSSHFTFVEEELTKANLVELCQGATYIFHQAAQAGVRASWGREFADYTTLNVLGTQRLLEAAKHESVRGTLKNIVYASSSSIYGHAETLPTHESLRPQPISPYGVTKLAAEHLMCLYASEFDVPTVSLRYFTVYGPRQRPDMAFHKFIKAMLLQTPIEIYGDGEQSRDFTFIEDVVDVNMLAAENAAPGSVFNIGGGSRVTVNEMLHLLQELAGAKATINYIERQKGDARHTSADTTAARAQLGYDPKVSLEAGLSRELDWLKTVYTA